MIDLHTHILPGLDDGAQNLEDSVAMAHAAVADGIRIVAATPHVRDDYPTTAAEMERGVAAVRQAIAAAGLSLDLRTGGEIALDRLGALDPVELSRFGLGGKAGYLLLEFPYYGWPLGLGNRLFELRRKGFIPVLAHPERNAEVQGLPERLRELVEQGAFVQVTSASLDGRLGRTARRTAFRLFELGLGHLVASDAHGPDVRAIGMRRGAEALGDPVLARWLTMDVPAAILAGQPIPDRPAAPPCRRRRFRI